MTTDSCPYCKFKFIKLPSKKSKCPNCFEYVYVRTLPDTKEKMIVTEKEASEIDKKWEEINFKKRWHNDLFNRYGGTIDEYNYIISKSGSPFTRDHIYTMLNSLADKNSRNNKFNIVSQIYYSMALFIYEEDKNPFELIRLSRYYELIHYKNQGMFSKVRILTCSNTKKEENKACLECSKQHGLVFEINEALDRMPIPCNSCSHNKDIKSYPFCRCMWSVVIE
jgi:hypothetical protein